MKVAIHVYVKTHQYRQPSKVKPRDNWDKCDEYRKTKTIQYGDYFDIAKDGRIDIDTMIDVAENMINIGLFHLCFYF